MAIKCKRIIDGKTYNTETSNQIAGVEDDNPPYDSGRFLYQTRHGAFFLFSYLDGANEDDFDTIEPYTPDQARQWLEKHASYQPELIEQLFGTMPEAGSGESKFTLRMPDRLRDRLAERAKANGQSLNAWMVRWLEYGATAPTLNPSELPPTGSIYRDSSGRWRPKGQ